MFREEVNVMCLRTVKKKFGSWSRLLTKRIGLFPKPNVLRREPRDDHLVKHTLTPRTFPVANVDARRDLARDL